MFNYDVKSINVEVGAGSYIGDVLEDLIALRMKMNADEITLRFNGVDLVVVAGSSSRDLMNQYQTKLQRGVQYD